jgi:hypothetical protein
MFLMKRTAMRQPADEADDDDDNDDAAAAAAAADDDDDDAPDEFSKDFGAPVTFALLLNLAAWNLLPGEKMLRRHISIFGMPQS